MKTRQPRAGARLSAEIDSEISRLAETAGQKALAGEPVDAEMDRIEALQRVRAALPPPPSHFVVVVVGVGLACLLVASLAWTLPTPTTRIQLVARTTNVTLRLAEPLRWTGDLHLASELIRLQHVSRIDLPPEYVTPTPLAGPAWLNLTIADGRATLRRLMIEKDATVTFVHSQTGTAEIATHGIMSGELDAAGLVSATMGSTPAGELRLGEVRFDGPPALFGFAADGTGAEPSGLRMPLSQPLVLHDLAVSGLGLMEERADANQRPTFVSALLSGTLTLTDTGEKLVLAEDAALRLLGALGRVTTLRVGGEAITVTFEGTVSGVSLGSGDFARDLKPSILEYLYHQERLQLFWGAITFLWGLFWSARKLLSRREQPIRATAE